MLMSTVASQLTLPEQQVYDALCEAAANGEPCPLNLDLEMITGFSSGSMGPVLVARLEAKGLIRVRRYQRFREVQIVATGQWTARSPSQHVERAHVPRGARSGSYPTGGRIAKKARGM
jgi:hypothetical protein